LGFGGSAVDFVGQQNLGKNRPFFEVKLAGGHIKHAGSQNIGGHQVRGKLDAPKVGLYQLGHGFGHQGFGCAWHSLQ
jgi:hypothetical protein